ncbi:MAG: hypothetical protein EBQ92_08090 [Proteobacteria bacterium]|nr:hypothetical protein [Pseudomonadota bacterium]
MTIQAHGTREFNNLTQKEMTRGTPDPAVIPSPQEFWSRTKADFDHLGLFLKRRLSPLRLPNPLTTLKSATAFFAAGAGFIFSWSVPQKDIRFSSRNREAEAIFIHRPLVVALSIFISWLIQMLILTESHPSLSSTDRDRLKLMKGVLLDFRSGFDRGIYRKELLLKLFQSLRVIKKREDIFLKVDASLLNWLESQIKNS